MTHPDKACLRCGWIRTTNTKTPDLCTSCRGANERVDVGDDHIEWHKTGLIYTGTIHPPTTTKGT